MSKVMASFEQHYGNGCIVNMCLVCAFADRAPRKDGPVLLQETQKMAYGPWLIVTVIKSSTSREKRWHDQDPLRADKPAFMNTQYIEDLPVVASILTAQPVARSDPEYHLSRASRIPLAVPQKFEPQRVASLSHCELAQLLPVFLPLTQPGSQPLLSL